MISTISTDQTSLEDIISSEFYITSSSTKEFEVYIADCDRNILILKFNENINEDKKSDWLLYYCENISNINVSKYRNDSIMLKENNNLFEDDIQNKTILLILYRDFHKFINMDCNQLSRFKHLDNVLVKYSDNLTGCMNSTEKISLIEVILRLHELLKYGKIKYIIINQFKKLIDTDDYLSNETKSILYSFIYSLISNINSGNRRENQVKIIIID